MLVILRAVLRRCLPDTQYTRGLQREDHRSGSSLTTRRRTSLLFDSISETSRGAATKITRPYTEVKVDQPPPSTRLYLKGFLSEIVD